jgi:hypothetical protein
MVTFDELDDDSDSVKQDVVSDINHQNQNFGASVHVEPISEKNSAELRRGELVQKNNSAEFSQLERATNRGMWMHRACPSLWVSYQALV